MVINSRPKLQLVHFLLFTTVSFAMTGARPRGVLALTSSAIQVAVQERNWKAGDRVEVQWKGDWYQAGVIEVKGDEYKVHYDGYASSWDEWVDNSRIRPAGIKHNNSITSQSETA